MDKIAFAACMKRNREKQGITFENLAEKTGISIGKLIEFESGEFERIKASELEKIGKVICVPKAILMHGGGEREYEYAGVSSGNAQAGGGYGRDIQCVCR